MSINSVRLIVSKKSRHLKKQIVMTLNSAATLRICTGLIIIVPAGALGDKKAISHPLLHLLLRRGRVNGTAK